MQFHGEPFDAANPPGTRQRSVGPGLFAAMGTRIIRAATSEPGDIQTTLPVAIVNKTFAERYLKGRDPIGAQFSAGYPAPDPKQRSDGRRRRRRCAAEVARRACGARVLLAADASSARDA